VEEKMKLRDFVPFGNYEKVLMHICCAPDATYPFLYLTGRHYNVTGFFYNSNIQPEDEYKRRLNEVKKLSNFSKMPLIEGEYNPEAWFEMVKGLEKEREGGARCYICYEERLEKTAMLAAEKKFDFFTTTISISPHKKSQWVFEIGDRLEKKYGVKFLKADFKKHNGFRSSIVLSRYFGLYRQNYCGCIYSKVESENYRINKS
jgi:predicted adenine nucleotide alpha hydrolase (AANH) superfamily ATPase